MARQFTLSELISRLKMDASWEQYLSSHRLLLSQDFNREYEDHESLLLSGGVEDSEASQQALNHANKRYHETELDLFFVWRAAVTTAVDSTLTYFHVEMEYLDELKDGKVELYSLDWEAAAEEMKFFLSSLDSSRPMPISFQSEDDAEAFFFSHLSQVTRLREVTKSLRHDLQKTFEVELVGVR